MSRMSNSIKIMLVIALMLASTGLGFSQEQYELTLEECITYAMKNNQNVLNMELEVEKQQKVVGEILSEGLPQIDVFVDLRNNFGVPTSFIPAIFFDENALADEFIPVKFSTQYTGNLSVGLKQLVFYGSYFVGVQAAKTFIELSTKEHIKTKIDVAEAVTKGFYSVLINEVALDLVEKNYNRLDSLLQETEIMFENGFIEKIDVNRIQVQFNNINTTLQNSKEMLKVSYQLLKFQMGMPINYELKLRGKLSDLGEMIYETNTVSFSYDDRIEYSVLLTREALAHYDLKNNTVQYLPRIDFFITGGANTGTNTLNNLMDANNWHGLGFYGLSMSIPVFDGLNKSYKIQQSRIKINQIENSFSLLENSIDLEIQTSRINLDNALRNLEAQETNMELSKEVYDVTKMKYQEGIGSNIELIEADATYKDAQNNYFNALYQVLISNVDLDKASGTLYK